MLVIISTFFIDTVASAFNISETLTLILDFIPTLLGLALLLKVLDIF